MPALSYPTLPAHPEPTMSLPHLSNLLFTPTAPSKRPSVDLQAILRQICSNMQARKEFRCQIRLPLALLEELDRLFLLMPTTTMISHHSNQTPPPSFLIHQTDGLTKMRAHRPSSYSATDPCKHEKTGSTIPSSTNTADTTTDNDTTSLPTTKPIHMPPNASNRHALHANPIQDRTAT